MKSELPIPENKLKDELASRDYELVQCGETHPDGSLNVEALKLHPVSLDDKSTVYVPVPVSLKVKLDKGDKMDQIEDETGNEQTDKAAEDFVKNLVSNKQVKGLSQDAEQLASHQIEVNEKGQRIIRRKGFSLY